MRALALVLVLAGCTRVPAPAACVASVVEVLGEGDAGCAGVVVAPRRVLTAAHCLDMPAARGFRVRLRDRDVAAQVVSDRVGAAGTWAPRARDLALLALAEPAGVRPATLRPAGAAAPRLLVLVGPGGFRLVLAPVRRADASRLVTARLTRPGDSGAPVFDERGRLAGIASSRTERASLHAPVSAADLREHLH